MAPAQTLNTIFPPGGQVEASVEIVAAGGGIAGLSSARCSAVGVKLESVGGNKLQATISSDTPPGLYDIQAVTANGISSTRAFFVTRHPHVLEADPKEGEGATQLVALNTVISGKIDKGDVDEFRFEARAGQRVVVETWAERIDSPLRAVLEVFDSAGKRLDVSRGYFGVDPLIVLDVPADGEYVARVHDLVYGGSGDHVYRLDIHTGPRVAFAVPSVLQAGVETEVTLYGWNLAEPEQVAASGTEEAGGRSQAQQAPGSDDDDSSGGSLRSTPATQAHPGKFESRAVKVTAPARASAVALTRSPAQTAVEAFELRLDGADVPVQLFLTDQPVALDGDNNSPSTAQALDIPGDVSGQLTRGDEVDLYAIEARRGEVLYVEALGERINSPVDLDVSVLDETGEQELARFQDERVNAGGLRFPSTHHDPGGRFVAPADGRYLIVVRNLTGGSARDPRRVYHLSVRREEPHVALVAVAHPQSPTGVNVPRGGRTVIDVLSFAKRGLNESVRVSARDLPPGISCEDVWIGPGETSAPLVLTASEAAEPFVGTLNLVGATEHDDSIAVQGGTMIRTGSPNGSGRLTDDIAWSVAGEAPIRVNANGHETRNHQLYGELVVRHSPGSVVDVAVHIERREPHSADVQLIGEGLPGLIQNQTSSIPAGQDKGHISFHLPPSLPIGRYTLVIRATTTVPKGDKTANVTAFSNAVTFEVHPPAFRVDIDPYAPRKIKPGQIVQIKYSARRTNGFISKIHTELAAPGKVTDVGPLRGRGVTFVGQTETGTIQIIANEDAEPGRIPFLRLYGVGVLEDEALFHGSAFLDLEIVAP